MPWRPSWPGPGWAAGRCTCSLDPTSATTSRSRSPAEQLAEAVRRVHAGLRVVDPALAAESLTSGPSPLTAREQEVLRVALTGASAPEMAARLHLSEGTIRNHPSSAIGKTGTRNRGSAASVARDNGWL